MLRAAAQTTARQSCKSGGRRLQSSQAGGPPKPPPGPTPAAPKKAGGGAGKKLLFVTGLTAATGGGVLGYAYVDPEFRKKVEETVPPIKEVFDSVLGESSLDKTKAQLEDVKQRVVSAIPKRKESLESPAGPPLQLDKLPPIEKKPPVHVDPVDVRPPSPASPPRISPELAVKRNSSLEDSLLSALSAAEKKVQLATDAKLNTIQAIRNHANLLKKTVDDGQNANWDAVTAAIQEAEKYAHKDASSEVDGRNYIDNLKKVIAEGKSNEATRTNPLLLNATETANKLAHQLDEMNLLVSKSRQEAKVFNEYKDLIDRSRQQFALELKSILPNVDVHAKDKNLSEEELNALIAHAHLRVDQLRRQLAEHQLLEEQNIVKALEEQKRADEKNAQERLELELRRVREQQEVDIERSVVSSRSTWEQEAEERLKRASAAHSEHLEQVIRTQRQLFEIEQNQKVEEAVRSERDLHSRHVGQALTRLEGIEAALSGRVALDAENRRAKQFWVACHHLVETIVHGNRAGATIDERRAPLDEQLGVIRQVLEGDEFANKLLDSFSEESLKKGVYAKHDLRNRFDKVYALGNKTSMIDANGGSLGKYFWSLVKSTFTVDVPRRFTDEDKIDPLAIDNVEVLARARWYVQRDDFESAARVLALLSGQPRQIASDWIADARAHLETKFLAELLVAHAAVSSIRSTY